MSCRVHSEPEYHIICMGSSQAAKQNQTIHGDLTGMWLSIQSLLALWNFFFSSPKQILPTDSICKLSFPPPQDNCSLHSRILIKQAIFDFFWSFTANSITFHILDLRFLSRSLPLSAALLSYDLAAPKFSLLKCTFQLFQMI